MVCAESPRFLIKKQRWQEAYKSLVYFNKAPLLAARELFYINAQIKTESEVYSHVNGHVDVEANGHAEDTAIGTSNPVHEDVYQTHKATSYLKRLIQLFTVPRIRRATTGKFESVTSPPKTPLPFLLQRTT